MTIEESASPRNFARAVSAFALSTSLACGDDVAGEGETAGSTSSATTTTTGNATDPSTGATTANSATSQSATSESADSTTTDSETSDSETSDSTSSGSTSGRGSSGAGSDSSGSESGGDETGGAVEGPCPFPAIEIAGTPETDALADAPARCGAPEYSWLGTNQLGTVGALGLEEEINVDIITLLLLTEGVLLTDPPDHDVALQQFSYMTQDRGELVEATALVAFPTDLPDDAPPNDVILWLHGTTGLTDGCGATETQEYQAAASLFAGYGYTVVMPDYIGLGFLGTETDDPHPYLVGEATAIASLDAVRAAARLDPADRGDTCMTTRFAVFGGSQGGHAALWVDRIAPYYARELEMVGVVATVPPAALLRQTEFVFSNFVSGTGNLTAAMVAMSSWYGAEDQLGSLFVDPWPAQLPPLLVSGCDIDPDGLPTDLPGLLQPDIIAAAGAGTLGDVDPWGCFARENDIGATSVPRLDTYPDSYGVLFVTAEDDSLVNTGIERIGYDELCDGEMPLAYLECEGANHQQASFFALPEALEFIEDRFDGAPFASVCPATAPQGCEGESPF